MQPRAPPSGGCWMLDRYWDGSMAPGARHYSFEANRAGFVLMMVWLLVSFALILFTRET